MSDSQGTPQTPAASASGPYPQAMQPRERPENPAVVKPVSLTERAYRELEELITTLKLPPGGILGEQTLMNRLSIGRTPIREALQRLARDRLVTIMPRRGVLVSQIDVRRQLRLVETRRVLERLTARLAAERANEAERETFAGIATGMRRAANDLDDLMFMRLDREFNERLAEAGRNEFAVRALDLMSGLSRRFWYQHYRLAGDLPVIAKLHADLCDAVVGRDGAKAEAASDRLIDYIEAFTRKTVEA